MKHTTNHTQPDALNQKLRASRDGTEAITGDLRRQPRRLQQRRPARRLDRRCPRARGHPGRHHAMLAKSHEPDAEEWAIHDYEQFGRSRIYEHDSIELVSRIAKGIQEHGYAFSAWIDVHDGHTGELRLRQLPRGIPRPLRLRAGLRRADGRRPRLHRRTGQAPRTPSALRAHRHRGHRQGHGTCPVKSPRSTTRTVAYGFSALTCRTGTCERQAHSSFRICRYACIELMDISVVELSICIELFNIPLYN